MSKVYYLVCHSKQIAVAIGDDAVGDVNIWPEQIDHMNNFLNITKGENIITCTDEDESFDDWYDDYIVLGQFP